MSTFYLLPPRPLLAARFTEHLQPLFPGLDWTRTDPAALPDLLAKLVAQEPDVYVIFREELSAGEEPERALVHGFGAEPGDEVVEVRPGPKAGEVTARRWQVNGAVGS